MKKTWEKVDLVELDFSATAETLQEGTHMDLWGDDGQGNKLYRLGVGKPSTPTKKYDVFE